MSIGDAFGERFFVGDESVALDLIARRVVPDGTWRWTDDTAIAITVAGLGDRDTTCAIVGGITACAGAIVDLPPAWRARREALPPA